MPMTVRPSSLRRTGSVLAAFALGVTGMVLAGTSAHAAIVPTVPLATAADYAVLGGSTVTNTGNSVLNGSLGLSPGGSITGFPPGVVGPPGTIDVNNGVAMQAQADLTAAYLNAAGRPITATTTSDLANLHLQAGVYAGPDRSALSLSGPLVLDGAGDLSSVFIFQTNSELITGSGSTVTLVNGAQECNVFWQVGSSATLGTGSVFSGNIMALTSISLNDSVTVRGRALARNGAVTLINDTFTRPTCTPVSSGTTTTADPSTTSTTSTGGTTTTTAGGAGTVAVAPIADATGGSATPAGSGGGSSTATATATATGGPPTGTSRRQTDTRLTSQDAGAPGIPGVPSVVGPPRTGVAPPAGAGFPRVFALLAALLAAAGMLGCLRWRAAKVIGEHSTGR